MGVSYGRTRVADLAFQVFSRSVHPDWFAVREHVRIGQEGWEADLRVIEGGHAVVFRSGSIRLTEVLAGPETLLPEQGLLFHSPIRHEPHDHVAARSLDRVSNLLRGRARVDAEVFAHLSDEMTLDASRGRLFHKFSPLNRMAPAPISHIRYEARIRGLTIHAFHSFPDERAIVRTQSLIEPKKR